MGTNVVYMGPTPTIPSVNNEFYSWCGWDIPLNNITTDTTFTAQYKNTGDTYYCYVTYINYDGLQLYDELVFKGGVSHYYGKKPTRPADVDGTLVTSYYFDGWTNYKDSSNYSSEINETRIYQAHYQITQFTGYRVDYLDGQTCLYSYYCRSGLVPNYGGELPFKYDDETVQLLIGWDGPKEPIYENTTYYAQFVSIPRTMCGEYPSTVVTDSEIIEELNTMSPNSNGIIEHAGNKYSKKVKDRVLSNAGAIMDSGTYYFLVEPIKWRVLSANEDSFFVVSEYVIDTHRWNEKYNSSPWLSPEGYYANNYKHSEIREWLNGSFLSRTFSDDSLLLTTEVDNSLSSTNNDGGSFVCEATYDKVFLLSYQEVLSTEYGFNPGSSYTHPDSSRAAKSTDYMRESDAECMWYWLRSPASNASAGYAVKYIATNGDVYSSWTTVTTECGIRPALTFKRP